MIKVLVYGMTDNYGGVESFIKNYYRYMDKSQVQFDFLTNTHQPIAFEAELEAMGAKIYKTCRRMPNPWRYHQEINQFFAQHGSQYDVFWMNAINLVNLDYLKLAKRYGIKRRIIHSHNSQNMADPVRGRIHQWHKEQVARYATDFWACSKEAVTFFYPPAIQGQARVINNAIDLAPVAFDPQLRHVKRQNLGIDEDTYLIGNVGRLHFQKNQSFLIQLAQYLKQNEQVKFRLYLIGLGPDQEALTQQIQNLGLEHHVIMAGSQTDIAAWLSAMDCFVMPSVFEGLPVAALEAQANGLPFLYAKDGIPPEVEIVREPYVKGLCLDDDLAIWADQLKTMLNLKRNDSAEIRNQFGKAGFDVQAAAKELQAEFCKEGGKNHGE
ncbi:glycosyltransferase [Vaginisenegalia massiliensis]|uniref:glycosyltransferase n=1 Tax=Vaginisenegalia massiliensis TaxID=2058294 RepID=UPI000F522866|nr:glycosyltransferase [Vaginisenegalia massiliensis]